MRSQKVQKKAAKAGFDWDNVDGALAKIFEELDELKEAIDEGGQISSEEELGDLLFSVVNVARFIHVDSEQALSKACDKFISRFGKLEALALERGMEVGGQAVLGRQ